MIFGQIIAILLAQTRQDFSGDRSALLIRCVRQRMQTLHLTEEAEYLHVQQVGEDELRLLVQAAEREFCQELEQQVADLSVKLGQSNQSLRAMRDRMTSIVDTVAQAVIILDESGRMELFNKAAEAMFGLCSEEACGQSFTMLLPKEVGAGMLADLRRNATDQPATHSFECQALRKDGTAFPAEVTMNRSNQWSFFTAAVSDLTERKRLQGEVLGAVDAEQRRIARDLHDSLGQELVALGLVSESLFESLVQTGHPDLKLAEHIAKRARQLVADVRAVARGLAPADIDAGGIVAALRAFARRISEQTGVDCEFWCESPVAGISEQRATHLFRIAQEAVTNALKHGQPRHIEISFRHTAGGLELSVTDDGTGMPASITGDGSGLRNMNYRAEIINAQLTVATRSVGGTQVTCSIEGPYDVKRGTPPSRFHTGANPDCG